VNQQVTSRRAFLSIAGCARLAAREPELRHVDLWQKGDAGVHTYRIPSLIETRRHVLLAVADARHDSARDLPARISLVMRRSTDGGRSWSPSRTIRFVPEGGVGDSSLLLDSRTGRVWCFFNFGPPGIGTMTAVPGERTGPHTLQVHAMHSDDDGLHWSDPVDLSPQFKGPAWQAMFATSGTHFQTSRGRYIVPLVMRDSSGVFHSLNIYSDDSGQTWRAGDIIAAGTDESKALELADGTVMQNMRNGKTRAIALSMDGGINFGPVSHDSTLPDPSCNAGLARYRHGHQDLLIFTNAASTKRENLTVSISEDSGKSWPHRRVLNAGPSAYSTVIPLRGGDIGVLYERGNTGPAERITFARFPLAWVMR
jgi:sialidase-1